MSIGEKTIWKERQKNKFRQSQQLIAREGESRSPGSYVRITHKNNPKALSLPELKRDILICTDICKHSQLARPSIPSPKNSFIEMSRLSIIATRILRRLFHIHTSESINWRSSSLLDLSNNTRRASGRSHHVGKRIKGTVSFCIRRGWLVVRGRFPGRFSFRLLRERRFGIRDNRRGGFRLARFFDKRRRRRWWRKGRGRRSRIKRSIRR